MNLSTEWDYASMRGVVKYVRNLGCLNILSFLTESMPFVSLVRSETLPMSVIYAVFCFSMGLMQLREHIGL